MLAWLDFVVFLDHLSKDFLLLVIIYYILTGHLVSLKSLYEYACTICSINLKQVYCDVNMCRLLHCECHNKTAKEKCVTTHAWLLRNTSRCYRMIFASGCVIIYFIAFESIKITFGDNLIKLKAWCNVFAQCLHHDF